MASYLDHEYRILSFQLGDWKGTSWPHQQPSIEQMIDAGFTYTPQSTPGYEDNVKCVNCKRALFDWNKNR